MSHHTRPSHRRTLAVLATGITLTLAMTLTQCRPVGDNVIGVELGAQSSGASNCIAVCARAYGDSMRVESDLHVTNVKACAGDGACLAFEATRFQQAVQRIQAGRRACQNACHHQGGGQGGR
jgi:hypothetical protein